MSSLDEYEKPRQHVPRSLSRKRILIVTEGAVTEKYYFEAVKKFVELRANQLVVHEVHVEPASENAGSTPARIVESAKTLREKAKKLQRAQNKIGNLEAREEYDEVWVVFDTERDGQRIDLEPAAEHADEVGIKVAISRPSFECWFLLHLRDGLPTGMATCSDVCRELSRMTKSVHGRAYSKTSRKNADLVWLIKEMLPVTQEAVKRSERIGKEAFCTHPLVPDQCATKVHELVCVLWRNSKSGAKEFRRRHHNT